MSSPPIVNQQVYSKLPDRSVTSDHMRKELHSAASAVSWGAIVAGAAAAAALSLVLLILGTGLGLSSVSPWAMSGISADTLGWSAILWITLTQVAAAALGGYLAGRLRSRWLVAQRDEVYFRDTAHGFLAWAVATLLTAALLSSAVSMIVGTGASMAGGTVAASTAMVKPDTASSYLNYYVDRVLRKDMNAAAVPTDSVALNSGAAPLAFAPNEAEMLRLFSHSVKTGSLAEDDLRYAGQWVAQRTGMPLAQAQARVSTIYAEAQAALLSAEASAKRATDAARKTSAYTALWLVIALMMGAFSASVAATLGGRQRDT